MKAKLGRMTIVALVISVLLTGCGTLKGLKGVGRGLDATAKGVADDAKGLWKGIVKADAWMREHLW